MTIEKQGDIYQLSAKIKLPIDIHEAWEFLSDPGNLKLITPSYMGFHIMSDLNNEMYAGQIISYKVSPLLGIKLNWVTEISHVKKPVYFVDEQRFGPYALWHHKHFIEEIENGVEMTDIVHYKLPVAWISNNFHGLLVKPKLEQIFNYRSKVLHDLFGTYEDPS
jgi:ligand-binding SRPBCC domain-containing protein